jgi:G3E family GTPase
VSAPLPTVLVAGSLGAGKTTLVNATIAACPELRVAVIENEAGEVSIDRDLLTGAARVVDVVGGCACCSLRGELQAALELVADRGEEIDAVIVEASGIADPVAIIQSFQATFARAAFRLTALACVLDSSAHEDELMLARQLRHADLAVLSRANLTTPDRREVVQRQAAAFAPHARVVDSVGAPALVAGYFNAPIVKPLADVPSDSALEAGSAHGFTAVTIAVDGALDRSALERWLALLPLVTGDVLRVKGVIALAGSHRRHLIQGVGTRIEIVEDTTAIGSWRRSRIVVIGRRLDRGELQAGIDACRAGVVRHA